MKTIIVACGAGVATSTVICSEVSKILDEAKIAHRIIQCSLNELDSNVNGADLIVTSMPVAKNYGIPLVMGISLLMGIGKDQTKAQILDALSKT